MFSPTEEQVQDAKKWADLFAILDTFQGQINLTKAHDDPTEYTQEKEAGDIMILFPPER